MKTKHSITDIKTMTFDSTDMPELSAKDSHSASYRMTAAQLAGMPKDNRDIAALRRRISELFNEKLGGIQTSCIGVSNHAELPVGWYDVLDEDGNDRKVLVIWCATREQGDTTVVGWYKHAQVWRDLQTWFLELNNGEDEERCYNVLAGAANCTLLPQGERNVHKWSVPSARYNGSYGFGQSMVWYPTQPAANEYLNRLIANIESYSGENWLNSYPEEKQS